MIMQVLWLMHIDLTSQHRRLLGIGWSLQELPDKVTYTYLTICVPVFTALAHSG